MSLFECPVLQLTENSCALQQFRLCRMVFCLTFVRQFLLIPMFNCSNSRLVGEPLLCASIRARIGPGVSFPVFVCRMIREPVFCDGFRAVAELFASPIGSRSPPCFRTEHIRLSSVSILVCDEPPLFISV